MTITKPFRWTRQHKNIRILLDAGRTKDDIMQLIRKGQEKNNWRESEKAMHLADWSQAIDRVQKRLEQ